MKKESKKSVGRPKIIDGITKKIVCTPKEFELIKELLKSIRNEPK